MSRNKDYENRMKDKGLKKVTLWIPQNKESDLKEAAQVMCLNDNLTVRVLSDVTSGRFVSMTQH